MRKLSSRRWGAIVAVAICGLLGAAITLRAFAPYADETASDSTSMLPPITSTQMLVLDSDIVMTGTILSATESGTSSRPRDRARDLEPATPGDPWSLELPSTEYVLRPDYVFKDDGTIASGMPVVLRLIGQGEAAGGDPCGFPIDDWIPLEPVGSRHLYFLTREPDSGAYGLYYQANSRLDLAGPEVQSTWCTPRTIDWTENVAPAAFLAELAAALN